VDGIYEFSEVFDFICFVQAWELISCWIRVDLSFGFDMTGKNEADSILARSA